jgi:hypothetical protein
MISSNESRFDRASEGSLIRAQASGNICLAHIVVCGRVPDLQAIHRNKLYNYPHLSQSWSSAHVSPEQG